MLDLQDSPSVIKSLLESDYAMPEILVLGILFVSRRCLERCLTLFGHAGFIVFDLHVFLNLVDRQLFP